MAVEIINNTVNLDSSVLTLLVFGVYLHIYNID